MDWQRVTSGTEWADRPIEIVRLGDHAQGRFTLQPGWRWSGGIKPVVKTDNCQVAHVGHAVSGRLAIPIRDGKRATIAPEMSYTIKPGHDAWVEGMSPLLPSRFGAPSNVQSPPSLRQNACRWYSALLTVITVIRRGLI